MGKLNSLYENTDVRENIVKEYLRGIGVDPLGQDPLPNVDTLPPIFDLKKRVANYIPAIEPWAFKGAKLALIWPRWAEWYPHAKWILVRRDKDAIVASCMRTGFMRAFTQPQQWGKWVEAHEKQFERMKETLDVFEVWPGRVMEEPESFADAAAFCGLSFDPKIVRNAIDESLWHGG